MGSNLIIVVFAIVVIGGMGSVMGAIVSGLALGVIEGLAKVFYSPISTTVVFILMAVVLTVRRRPVRQGEMTMPGRAHIPVYMVWGLLLLAIAAPWLGLYPVLGMRMMCFALFACAFNLLAGYTGLISFGHAALSAGRATSPAWRSPVGAGPCRPAFCSACWSRWPSVW